MRFHQTGGDPQIGVEKTAVEKTANDAAAVATRARRA